MGLFTAESSNNTDCLYTFKEDDVIDEYIGEIKVESSIEDINNPYLLRCGTHLIDAQAIDSCYCRYTNEGLSDNVNAKLSQEGGKVFLVATKKIPSNTEILCKYGREYWNSFNKTLSFKNNKGKRIYKAIVDSYCIIDDDDHDDDNINDDDDDSNYDEKGKKRCRK